MIHFSYRVRPTFRLRDLHFLLSSVPQSRPRWSFLPLCLHIFVVPLQIYLHIKWLTNLSQGCWIMWMPPAVVLQLGGAFEGLFHQIIRKWLEKLKVCVEWNI